MSQHDFVIDGGSTSRTAVRTDIQSGLQALASLNKGPAAPLTPYTGMVWLDDDTPSAAIWTLNQYDGTDWIPHGTLNSTTNLWTAAGSLRGLYVDLGAVSGDSTKILRLTTTAIEMVATNQVGVWEMIDTQTLAAATSWISPTIDTAYRYLQLHYDLLPDSDATSLVMALYDSGASEITSGYSTTMIRGYDNGTVDATGVVATNNFFLAPGGELSNDASNGGIRGTVDLGDIQSARYKRGEASSSYHKVGYSGIVNQCRAGLACATTSIIKKIKLRFSSANATGTVRLLGMR